MLLEFLQHDSRVLRSVIASKQDLEELDGESGVNGGRGIPESRKFGGCSEGSKSDMAWEKTRPTTSTIASK